MQINLIHGDCLEKLKLLDDDSIDSCVTDPPYGLAFMGKKWDYDVPSVEVWREVLRVLKPGGHLLSFGGTRTYHRMVINIEDAGFEIRDQIQWIYGSGFPKSMDISKAIDKQAGVERETYRRAAFGGKFSDDNGSTYGTAICNDPATESAKQWQGWGTALKPSNEPICLARKPISEKTVAQNVLKYGTGAMNIDESRIQTEDNLGRAVLQTQSWKNTSTAGVGSVTDDWKKGRWPANVIFDEEAGEILDKISGVAKPKAARKAIKSGKGFGHFNDEKSKNSMGVWSEDLGGGASRFFYCAKSSKSERNAGLEGMPVKHVGTYTQDEWSRQNMGNTPDNKREPVQNFHPTVKPIKLMSYLVKLITPPNGACLDPFMGSGSTGLACKNNNFSFTGIERDEEYFKIAKERIEANANQTH